ncbi:MAG: 30S ribosome-binding factor RbfA [Pseudomonadota bacterium]
MANQQRVERVADQIQRLLAQLLQHEVKDPRIGFVTVSEVTISKDLSYADVQVSWLDKESPEEIKNGLAALAKAAGFLRSSLAKSIQLRVIPKLRFHHDTTLKQAFRIESLLRQANIPKLDSDSDSSE